jgi:uncharacterized delta-60 repeat protein
MKKKIILLISIIGFISYSQNYVLDNTFGISGLATTTFGQNLSFITSLELQTDGKILACGNNKIGNSNQLVISRYNADGTLDNSFGTLGKVITSIFNDGVSSYFKIKLQSDGKILIGGSSGATLGATDFVILRLNIDGSFDNTFGTNGITITDINNKTNVAICLEIQNDNKILLAGRTYTDFEYDNIAVVKYNSNGTLDNSFGNLGIFTLDIGGGGINASIETISSIKFLPNGKILLGGSTDDTSAVESYNFLLMRLNNNGSIDTTFGINGKTITNFGDSESIASLNITSDNKIIAAGSLWNGTARKICLAKYSIDGNIDTTFGNNGIVITQINSIAMNDQILQATLITDNKLLCTGVSNNDFLMVRYNSNGTLDNSFNMTGFKTTDFFGSTDVAYSSISQTDGTILLGGGSTNQTIVTFAIAKYKVENLFNDNFFVNNNFEIYPNPTKDVFVIRNINAEIITEINIYDMQNKNIIKEKNNFNKINIENLKTGIYNLIIKTRNEKYNYKIIKE